MTGKKERTANKFPYYIILADDHVFFRNDLEKIIREKRELRVVGHAGDGLELLDLLKNISPDMVILDISMPKLNGIKTTRTIKMRHPDVAVLILTINKDNEYLNEALSAGANGYLLKEDAYPELFSAIESIRQGRVYISPHFSES
jgi:DNA-binding NarL/FixJ family response regulator